MTPQRVVLKNYPVQLGLANVEHVNNWMREFQLMKLSDDTGTQHEVPDRLRAMVDHVTTTYAKELSVTDRARLAAAGRGDATMDLEYELLPESERIALAWQAMAAEVDGYCADAELLTLQRPPLLVEFNDWVVSEFVRQAHGEPPQPWSGPLAL